MRTRSYNQNEALYIQNEALYNYRVWFENKRPGRVQTPVHASSYPRDAWLTVPYQGQRIKVTTDAVTAVKSRRRCVLGFINVHSVATDHLGELRLDGGGMDSFVMEELLDTDGNSHVVGCIATADVCRGNDSCRRQLPDMQLVYVLNLFHLRPVIRYSLVLKLHKIRMQFCLFGPGNGSPIETNVVLVPGVVIIRFSIS